MPASIIREQRLIVMKISEDSNESDEMKKTMKDDEVVKLNNYLPESTWLSLSTDTVRACSL